MSRVGKRPIAIPAGVTTVMSPGKISVRGPKGEVEVLVHPHVTVREDDAVFRVTVAAPDKKRDRALWGLTARLMENAVMGVTRGFDRQLEIHGVGFRVELRGNVLDLALGFSHPVHFELPPGVTATVEKNTITLRAVDRQLLGDTAARIRRLRKPDAYHGKGVRFAGEVLKLKPGKAAKGGAAAK